MSSSVLYPATWVTGYTHHAHSFRTREESHIFISDTVEETSKKPLGNPSCLFFSVPCSNCDTFSFICTHIPLSQGLQSAWSAILTVLSSGGDHKEAVPSRGWVELKQEPVPGSGELWCATATVPSLLLPFPPVEEKQLFTETAPDLTSWGAGARARLPPHPCGHAWAPWGGLPAVTHLA